MTLPVGDLVASIRLAGLPQFEQDNARAQQTFTRTGAAGAKAGSAARTALNVASVGIVGLTAASAAYTTSLFRQGMAYNTLQQTSRAALTTILGGTKAANDQMAKMDDFASKSPFSKGVFLQAQQQLLGFGVEAKKVIPMLGAIQDAVAATGGSGQQIADITTILAQISSAGKITGQDLLQLGGRGIDAAGMIGESLGKTGAQIRESITDGALDAHVALDALTKGMERTYGGAAAGVKATWSGTVDRIKAASRDIGAALAEPFISQQKGGLAITWGNQVADVLRAVQGQVAPIVSILQTRAVPAFAAVTSTLDKARVIVKSWDSKKLESFLNNAAQYGPAVAAVVGGLLGINAQMLRGLPVVGEFVGKLTPLPLALAAIALTSPDVRAALGDLLHVFEPLLPVAEQIATILATGLNEALPVTANVIEGVVTFATPLVRLLAQLPTPVIAGGLAFFALNKAATPVLGLMKNLAGSAGVGAVVKQLKLLPTAVGVGYLDGLEKGTGRFGAALGVAGKGLVGFGKAMKSVFIANAPALIILGVVTAASALISVFAKQAEHTAELNKATAEYRDTMTAAGEATSGTAAAVKKNLNEALGESWGKSKDTTDSLSSLGLTMDGLTEAVVKGGPAFAGIIGSLQKTVDASDAQWEATKKNITAQNVYGEAMKQAAADQDNGTNATKDLIGRLKEQRDAIEKAERQQRLLTDAERDGLSSMTEFARSNARMNAALKIARDVSKDATERLSALKQALDELNGGSKTAAEQQKDLNDRARSLTEAFAAQDDKGNKLAKSLVSNAGAIDTTTAAGSALFDQVSGLNDQMLSAIQLADKEAKARGESGVSMDEASKKAQPYIDKLKEIASKSGLSQTQVDGLVSSMLDTPALVAYALTDDGTVDANKLRLAKFVTDLQNIPKGKAVVTDAATISGVEKDLKSLGFKIQHLPNGTVKVTKSKQSFDSVEDAIAYLTRDRTVHVGVSTSGAFTTGGQIQGTINEAGAVYQRGVQAFEAGGFPSGFYKGQGAPIHKFAEPHLPWEAYISPAPQHRKRNQAITAEVASRLGGSATFESGGIVSSFASGGLTVSSSVHDWITDQLRDWLTGQRRGTNSQQDGLSLVDKLLDISQEVAGKTGKQLRDVALRSEKAYVSLAKKAAAADKAIEAAQDRTDARVTAAQAKTDAQVELAQKKLAVAQESLSGTQAVLSKVWSALQSVADKASQMASSVASAVRNLFNLGDLGKPTTTTKTETVTSSQQIGGFTLESSEQVTTETTTPATAASIASSMKATAARIKRFADKLKKLAKKGLTPALLAELASLGVENGEPIADALLDATSAELASINSSYAAIDAGSATAGKTVADANYKALITAAEKQVALAQAQVDKAQAVVDATTRQIDTIRSQGQKTVDTIKAEGKRALDAALARQKTVTASLNSETSRIVRSITDALRSTAAAPVKKAGGGPVIGPGTGLSDSVPVLASNGEHVVTAAEVSAAGGHGNVTRIRQAMLAGTFRASGGPIGYNGTVTLPAAAQAHTAASGTSTAAAGVTWTGDLVMPVTPEPGEPLQVQALRAARRLESKLTTGR